MWRCLEVGRFPGRSLQVLFFHIGSEGLGIFQMLNPASWRRREERGLARSSLDYVLWDGSIQDSSSERKEKKVILSITRFKASCVVSLAIFIFPRVFSGVFDTNMLV